MMKQATGGRSLEAGRNGAGVRRWSWRHGAAGAAVLAMAALAAGGASSPSTPEHAAERSTSIPGSLLNAVNATMGLSDSALIRLDIDATPGVAKQTVVDLGGLLVTLDLAPHSVRVDGFRTFTSDAAGVLTEIEPAPERTYRGAVVGDADSIVGATVDDHGLSAQIILGDKRRFWVEPVAPQMRDALGAPLSEATTTALAGVHVVYQPKDVVDLGQTCGTETRNLAAAGAAVADGGVSSAQSGGAITAEIAFDIDSFYVSEFGVEESENRVTTIVNSGLNVMYPRDVQITYEITTFIFRVERVYFEDTIFDLLDAFQTRWNANHDDVVRDVAELFTGLNLSGSVIGVATLGSICEDNGYNVVEDFGNHLQRADLSAHELGHNWNAFHCACSEHTMNPSITGRLVFHPTFTIPDVIAFRDTITCARPTNDSCDTPQPTGDGAIAFDTIPATTDGGTTSCGVISKDLWFEYTAPCDGEATAQTCDADFDTRIAVYAENDCGGSIIACDDNSCGMASLMTFPVAAGQKYLIRVGGRNAIGTGTLVLSCVEEPCPDPDGSGSSDFGDILAILAAWGNLGGPEDVDGNGFVGFGDILVILGAWGPCP